MSTIERFQTLIILAAIGTGFLFGQIYYIELHADQLIIPFLLLMLYGLFLSIPVQQLKKAFLNTKFLGVSTVINFVWTPLLAWGLGAVFLADHPALWIGFIMLMVTPCTDWYLMFTGMAKGNVALSTSILPNNLFLQLLLLPMYLLIFAGTIHPIPFATLLESVLLVLVLPFLLAHLTRLLLVKRSDILVEKIVPFFSSAQIVFLALAIMAMFASQGSTLIQNFSIFYILIIPVLLYFVINYLLGRWVARLFSFSYEDSVSLTMTTIARNSPVALAIAVTAFPNEPLLALALVIGPLIELPVLTIIAQVLLHSKKRYKVS